jgi:hypothetical protein
VASGSASGPCQDTARKAKTATDASTMSSLIDSAMATGPTGGGTTTTAVVVAEVDETEEAREADPPVLSRVDPLVMSDSGVDCDEDGEIVIDARDSDELLEATGEEPVAEADTLLDVGIADEGLEGDGTLIAVDDDMIAVL